MMPNLIEPGRSATVSERVTEAMTAEALGSGDVPVLGTPAVLALAERAAIQAVHPSLPSGRTTVGTSVELRHRAPTPIGSVVEALAELVAVEGERLLFRIEITDGAGVVASGSHRRVIVDRAEFVADAGRRGGNRGLPDN